MNKSLKIEILKKSSYIYIFFFKEKYIKNAFFYKK